MFSFLKLIFFSMIVVLAVYGGVSLYDRDVSVEYERTSRQIKKAYKHSYKKTEKILMPYIDKGIHWVEKKEWHNHAKSKRVGR